MCDTSLGGGGGAQCHKGGVALWIINEAYFGMVEPQMITRANSVLWHLYFMQRGLVYVTKEKKYVMHILFGFTFAF